tara:strand:+ start:102 stop:695 length:594 start_codon:yes stop_codon:yes gene_type:complete
MKFQYGQLKLTIPKNVYYPREDSLLIASVLEEEALKGKKVLEIGCGSGLLSLIAASKEAEVTAVDINEKAVQCTQENAKKNKLKIQAQESDVFSNVKGKFDLIVSNPPYLPLDKGETADLTYSSGASGTDIIETILDAAPKFLLPAGKLLLLYSSLTDMRSLLDVREFEHISVKLIASKKLDFEELYVAEISFNGNH